ncbi:unnamed protein product [Nippostrongylus brasiliensis]|uniref:Uncharacterized protein n=1 Tax=Nippostrongylus brasiliensis TaxID=27835 RepID=A0A0N4XNN4_NIPBR|nr:unnamed protein product [Nippostrongylus brasiliensis]
METFCRGTEYAVTVQKAAENHTMNQHTELVPAKEAESATFDVSSEDLKSNMDNECIAASSEPPKTAFMMPSHNQFTSPAGSPISNSKLIRGCETISDCAISFLEEHTILRNRAESPAYDNATLDDLLAASTSWTEYLQKENERIEKPKRLSVRLADV